jgi:ribosomal protein S18 acetylase RimI-like enzyme
VSANLTLRLADGRDAEAIALESMAEIEHGFEWEWHPMRVAAAIEDRDTNVVVAVEGGAMVGFGIMEYRNEVAHLVLFAVVAEARRRGIGSAMLQWLEKVALVAGMGRFRVEARVSNTGARAFYARHGYVEEEVVSRMYSGRGHEEDGVRMQKVIVGAEPAALELTQLYGPEYPQAVTTLGRRLTLASERRFTRSYGSADQGFVTLVSKLQDGTAAITLEELKAQWAAWPQADRDDFLAACNGLFRQRDYPDMLRFLMAQHDPQVWSALALDVAGFLPQEEAFGLLVEAFHRTDAHTANLTQGIAATKHPGAAALLDQHLDELWAHPGLWEDDSFTNWIAFDAICCLAHLLDLGIAPADHEDKARRLSQHVCAGTRQSCAGFLGKHYDWMPKPNLGALGLDLPDRDH